MWKNALMAWNEGIGVHLPLGARLPRRNRGAGRENAE